jgi:hypothetical protein
MDASQQRRDHYAQQAKQCPPDHLLVIRMADHAARVKSDEPLQATIIPKSKLSLR